METKIISILNQSIKGALEPSQIDLLKEWNSKYPYFFVSHMVLAKHLNNGELLNKASLIAPDRNFLHDYMSGKLNEFSIPDYSSSGVEQPKEESSHNPLEEKLAVENKATDEKTEKKEQLNETLNPESNRIGNPEETPPTVLETGGGKVELLTPELPLTKTNESKEDVITKTESSESSNSKNLNDTHWVDQIQKEIKNEVGIKESSQILEEVKEKEEEIVDSHPKTESNVGMDSIIDEIQKSKIEINKNIEKGIENLNVFNKSETEKETHSTLEEPQKKLSEVGAEFETVSEEKHTESIESKTELENIPSLEENDKKTSEVSSEIETGSEEKLVESLESKTELETMVSLEENDAKISKVASEIETGSEEKLIESLENKTELETLTSLEESNKKISEVSSEIETDSEEKLTESLESKTSIGEELVNKQENTNLPDISEETLQEKATSFNSESENNEAEGEGYEIGTHKKFSFLEQKNENPVSLFQPRRRLKIKISSTEAEGLFESQPMIEGNEIVVEEKGGELRPDDPESIAQREILAKFLLSNPKLSNPREYQKGGDENLEDSNTTLENPVSETYAKILVSQGDLSSAIEVYQKLSLLFPEKRAYFADQIKELDK